MVILKSIYKTIPISMYKNDKTNCSSNRFVIPKIYFFLEHCFLPIMRPFYTKFSSIKKSSESGERVEWGSF